MTIALIIAVIVLWLLLGQSLRLNWALACGGSPVPWHICLYCYFLSPVAGVHYLFGGLFAEMLIGVRAHRERVESWKQEIKDSMAAEKERNP